MWRTFSASKLEWLTTPEESILNTSEPDNGFRNLGDLKRPEKTTSSEDSSRYTLYHGSLITWSKKSFDVPATEHQEYQHL